MFPSGERHAAHDTARRGLGKRAAQQLREKFRRWKIVWDFGDKMCQKSSLTSYVHATVQQHTSLSHKHMTNTDMAE